MLIRLVVSGFKNLVDTDVRFGPFTCIAGPNAVGKSNLFDAIRFLSSLADNTLLDAALAVRGEGKSANVRGLFHRVGGRYAERMEFTADMIAPHEGVDDLGQNAVASTTFLRYHVALGYRADEARSTIGSLELLSEKLDRIRIGDASAEILFRHDVNKWRASVLHGRRTTPFISTDGGVIKLSQDKRVGRPRSILAASLPRTVLSTVNASESPTALLARREMQSWRLLQLEPSALRSPDNFTTPPGLGSDGSGLPATLFHLARTYERDDPSHSATWVYEQVALRLSGLIDDVRSVTVNRDERNESLTLEVTDRSGTVYPARSLSDGTLRFLALAVLEMDAQASGLICLEEPENGIHPKRIPAMLDLLQAIATDVDEPVGADNPLRQVIINTHSPAVVQQVLDESLLVAEAREMVRGQERFARVCFSPLPDTWRTKVADSSGVVSRGSLLAYLNPTAPASVPVIETEPRRVIDRVDFRQLALPSIRGQP